jgi:hypothetical protein
VVQDIKRKLLGDELIMATQTSFEGLDALPGLSFHEPGTQNDWACTWALLGALFYNLSCCKQSKLHACESRRLK